MEELGEHVSQNSNREVSEQGRKKLQIIMLCITKCAIFDFIKSVLMCLIGVIRYGKIEKSTNRNHTQYTYFIRKSTYKRIYAIKFMIFSIKRITKIYV